MKQLLLATALIAVPVAGFTAFNFLMSPAPAQASASATEAGLGDVSPLTAIISDVQKIAATGDFAAAEKRITDFETAWDASAQAMRKMNPDAWGNVDQASDAALDALRSGPPTADPVNRTLAALLASLENPGGAVPPVADTAVALASGIAVTDAKGRALPCEVMIKTVTEKLAASTLPAPDKTAADALKTKALERCNADDDQRADQFSAQAIALLSK